MAAPRKYPDEVRERAVRLVRDLVDNGEDSITVVSAGPRPADNGLVTTASSSGSLAIVQRSYGAPPVLVAEEVPVPALEPGDIRVRSLASPVNYADLQVRAGSWPIGRPDPFPYVPGLEVVGEVVEVGAGVTEWRPGDVVVSMMQGMGGVRSERPGGYAELVTMPGAVAARVPANVDPVAAATIGLAGVTAYAGLRRCGVVEGATVLITGATGGVGSMAVRIAAALGARPVAVVRRPAAGADLAEAGAVRVVTAENLGGEAGSADAVVDSVAGPLFAPVVEALRPGGRYCLVGAAGGGAVTWDAFALLGGIELTGWSSETLDGPALRDLWQALVALLAAGRLVPPKPTLLPLTDAARAHELLEKREVAGRLLLTRR
jgi:NADPH2:quinone reductase